METNKELPTAEEFLRSNNAFEALNKTPYRDLIIDITSKYCIQFAQLHLANQPKVIAENAFEIYEQNGFTNTGYIVKQSIINVGEDYIIKNVK